MSEIRRRNLPTVVDTTQAAEFRIKGFQLSDTFMDRLARRLKAAPILRSDGRIGPLFVRQFEGYEFVYAISRDGNEFVVTIGEVWPVEDRPLLDDLLQKGDFVAMLRSETGV